MTLRLLPRHSGPVLGAIAVIAVGVGLAAMVFALADPYIGRDLPYRDSDRLVSLRFGLGDPGAMTRANPEDSPSLVSWQSRTDLFEGLAALDDAGWLSVKLSDRVVPLRAVAVSNNLLQVLGLELQPAADPTVAWVSTHAASTLFRGELTAGRSVPVVPAGTLRVESVLPDSFLLPQADRTDPVDALVILPPGPVIEIKRSPAPSRNELMLVGRMRQNVTPERVEAALEPSIRAIGGTLAVVPLRTAMTTKQLALARGAWLASALVILICWMNVFNIALTRGLYRRPELATRAALGATSRQLIELMFADGVRVAALGTAGALLVTWGTLLAAVSILPAQFATLGVPTVTMRVVFLVALAGAVAYLCWCFASIVAWRVGALHRAQHLVSRDGRLIRAMRFGVIAGQVSAAGVLLTAAALLGRSYLNLLLVDPGMDERAQTITVAHDPSLPPLVRSEVVERVVLALRRAEGVQAVGVRSGHILNGRFDGAAPIIEGQLVPLEWTRVDRGFLEAAGLHFVVGALPSPDRIGAVITESIALKYFPGRSPVGAVLDVGRAVPIVGVVRDVRTRGLSVPTRPVVYEVGATWPANPQSIFTYVVRMADKSQGLADLRRFLRSIDPAAAVLSEATVGDRLAYSVRDRTFAAFVVGLFTTASLIVTALGLAGVVAYAVVKRTQEIAVRFALGATRSHVTWLIVRDALTAGVCGGIGGVISSVWLSGALEKLLYDVRAADPTTLLLSATILVGIVVAAAVVPAIRTGRIAPATALRIE